MLKRTTIHLLAALLLAILSWTGITAPGQPAARQVGPSEAGAVDPLVAHGLHNLTGVRAGATAPQAGTDVVAPALASRAVSTAGSGAAMPSGNPAGWTQVFADDFSGTGLSGRWFAYGGQPGGDPGGYWSTSHVSVANGELILRGYRDARYGNKFVTAGVSTTHGFVQTYGKYLVRFRMDQGKGIAHAIMLWPADNSWPPEIDFSEDNGVTPRSLVTATVHYSMPGKTDTMVHRTASVDLSAWHTLGVEWEPGKVTYTLDGAPWATVRDPHISAVPMGIVLQTQAWSCGTNTWERCPDATTPAEVDLDVDWVVAYAPAS